MYNANVNIKWFWFISYTCPVFRMSLGTFRSTEKNQLLNESTILYLKNKRKQILSKTSTIFLILKFCFFQFILALNQFNASRVLPSAPKANLAPKLDPSILMIFQTDPAIGTFLWNLLLILQRLRQRKILNIFCLWMAFTCTVQPLSLELLLLQRFCL